MTDDSSTREKKSSSGRSFRKWVLGTVLTVFFAYLFWEVVNPYRNQSYEQVPHGDHVHYVPKDRDEDVPMSRFPTQAPKEGERITPDGQIVPDRQ